MVIKFNNGNYYNRNLFAPGVMYDLYSELKEAKANDHRSKLKNLLNEGELARIVEIYAAVPPGDNLLAVDNEDILHTPEGNEITGKDFKATVRLVYEYSRGDYSKVRQITNPAYSAGVPLGLLAYKNYYHKNYEDFRLDADDFKVMAGLKIKPASDTVIERVFKLDLLLGKALASTKINPEGTMVMWNTHYGLPHLCADIDVVVSQGSIDTIRESSFGKRKGNYLTGYGCSNAILEDHEEKYHDFLRLYNGCNSTLRHMLLQRWIYYMPENSNLITDFKNWDKQIRKIDEIYDNIKPMKVDNTKGDLFFG